MGMTDSLLEKIPKCQGNQVILNLQVIFFEFFLHSHNL